MKKIFGTWIFVLFTFGTTIAQTNLSVFHSSFEKSAFDQQDLFQILVAADENATFDKYKAYRQDIQEIANWLKKKQDKWSDEMLLWKLFYTIHQKKLKWYNNYITFSDLMDNGTYDCLTGTTFYALVLNELEIPYTIYEFDFHVFLVVNLSEGDFLFESTDPFYGYTSDPQEIKKHIDSFLNGGEASIAKRSVIGNQYKVTSTQVNKKIPFQHLVGLQYYNLAIKYHNQGEIYKSQINILKAWKLYPSRRMLETKEYLSSNASVTFIND